MSKKRRSKRAEIFYRDKLFLIIDATRKTIRKEIQLFEELNPTANELQIYEFLDDLLENKKRVDLEDLAKDFATQMVKFANVDAKKILEKDINSNFGIDITNMFDSKNVKDELNKALIQNVSLIKSLKDDFVTSIQDSVRNAFISGERHESLAKTIMKETGIAKDRARLIARDQITKISSELKQIRATDLGFDEYTWSCSIDGRQRKSHKEMNGKLCKFSDPTVYSEDSGKTWKKRTTLMTKTHPGEDICCRCDANITS